MTNKAKRLGTQWENEVVDYLNVHGWPKVERRTQGGANDKGDIAGVDDVVIEAKNCKTLCWSAWLHEAEVEAGNAGVSIPVVWAKRRGKASAGAGYVMVSGATAVRLLRAWQICLDEGHKI